MPSTRPYDTATSPSRCTRPAARRPGKRTPLAVQRSGSAGQPFWRPISISGGRQRPPTVARSRLAGSGHDALVVRAERRTQYSLRMVHDGDRTAGIDIPQPRGLVPGRGDDAPAVGAERHAAHNVRMTDERKTNLLAGVSVPQPRGLVRGDGDNAFAVGAEHCAAYIIRMACERVD